MVDFDYILDRLGPFGRYQKLHWIIAYLVMIPKGFHNILNVYLFATPDHWCSVPELSNLSIAEQRLLTAPGSDPTSDVASCFVRDVDYREVYLTYVTNGTVLYNGTDTRPCTDWEYDHDMYGTTAVTKWNLVCSQRGIPALVQSLYMFGFLLGAIIFGSAADRFGRKRTHYVTIVSMLLFSLISCFVPGLWGHVIARMMTGFTCSGANLISFVMGMEIIGRSRRLVPGLSHQMFFALGYTSLAGIASLTRDFFWTNLTVSLIPGVLLSLWWIIPESPRWLLAHGRVDDAKPILVKMAAMNGSKMDVNILLGECAGKYAKHQTIESDVKKYSFVDIVRTPNMRKKCVSMMFICVVTGMVYYGLSIGVADLGGNPYLNLAVSGISDCCSVLITYLVLDRLGRRICLSAGLVIGGSACIGCAMLPPAYGIGNIVLSMVGKLFVSSALTTCLVFMVELLPTVVRSIGSGAGSMSLNIGGLLAPVILSEMKVYWLPLPMLVFGLSSLAAGLLGFLLPETVGRNLPDTLEEGEQFGKDLKFPGCSRTARVTVVIERDDVKQY